MDETLRPGDFASAKVVKVIRITYGRGRGVPPSLFRRVTAYFTMDGELLAEFDPSGDRSDGIDYCTNPAARCMIPGCVEHG